MHEWFECYCYLVDISALYLEHTNGSSTRNPLLHFGYTQQHNIEDLDQNSVSPLATLQQQCCSKLSKRGKSDKLIRFGLGWFGFQKLIRNPILAVFTKQHPNASINIWFFMVFDFLWFLIDLQFYFGSVWIWTPIPLHILLNVSINWVKLTWTRHTYLFIVLSSISNIMILFLLYQY